jgi:hypothetical protein
MTKTLAVIAVATSIAVTAHSASAQQWAVPNAAPMQPYQQPLPYAPIQQFSPAYQPQYQPPPRTTTCSPTTFGGGFTCTTR